MNIYTLLTIIAVLCFGFAIFARIKYGGFSWWWIIVAFISGPIMVVTVPLMLIQSIKAVVVNRSLPPPLYHGDPSPNEPNKPKFIICPYTNPYQRGGSECIRTGNFYPESGNRHFRYCRSSNCVNCPDYE